MRSVAAGVCWWLLLASFALAGFGASGDLVIDPYTVGVISADDAPKGAAVTWDFDDDRLSARESGRKLYWTARPGTYKVRMRYLMLDKDGNTVVETVRLTLTVRGTPDPGPGPKPPEPKPPDPAPDGDAPIGGDGFRVLIVYESKTLKTLPITQQSVLFSKKVRDYLNSACIKDKQNPDGAYRIYDADVDLSAESKSWQDAMKRTRRSLPWVVISDGKSGHEGPLPVDVDSTIALLKKWGK